ncbi:MAG: hypothetical protein WKG00_09675 [Polyangiaceae bacterium]
MRPARPRCGRIEDPRLAWRAMRRPMLLALILAGALSTGSASAALTDSEKAQVRDFYARGEPVSAPRVRAMLARPDLTPPESTAALADAVRGVAFDGRHQAWVHELLFGPATAASRSELVPVVVDALLARAAGVATRAGDGDGRGAAELLRIHAFVTSQIASGGRPPREGHDGGRAIRDDSLKQAAASYRAHLASPAMERARTLPALRAARAQAELALLELSSGLALPSDVAGWLGADPAERAVLERSGLLVVGLAGAAPAKTAALVQMLEAAAPAAREASLLWIGKPRLEGLQARRGVLVAQAPLAGTKRVPGARLWSPRVVPSPSSALAEMAFARPRRRAGAGARQPAFLEMARAVQRRAEAAGAVGFLPPRRWPAPSRCLAPARTACRDERLRHGSAAVRRRAPRRGANRRPRLPPARLRRYRGGERARWCCGGVVAVAPPAGPGGATPASAIAHVPTRRSSATVQLLLLDGPRALVALAEAAAGRREAIEQFAMAAALLAMNGEGAVGDRAAMGRTDESGAVLPAELTKIAARGLEVERFTYDGHEVRLDRGPAGLTAVTRDGKPVTAAGIPFLQPDPAAGPRRPRPRRPQGRTFRQERARNGRAAERKPAAREDRPRPEARRARRPSEGGAGPTEAAAATEEALTPRALPTGARRAAASVRRVRVRARARVRARVRAPLLVPVELVGQPVATFTPQRAQGHARVVAWLGVLDARQHHGDVVEPPELVGARHQLPARRVQIHRAGDDLRQLVLVEAAPEAVAAEHEHIPGAHRLGEHIHGHRGAQPEGTGQHVARRRGDGLRQPGRLCGDLLGERVVAREQSYLPAAHQVGPTVADVGQAHRPRVGAEPGGHEGRAHGAAAQVGPHHPLVMNAFVRSLERLGEQRLVRGQLAQARSGAVLPVRVDCHLGSDAGRGHVAGQVTVGTPAHPVGHQEERQIGRDDPGILVPAPAQADVRPASGDHAQPGCGARRRSPTLVFARALTHVHPSGPTPVDDRVLV